MKGRNLNIFTRGVTSEFYSPMDEGLSLERRFSLLSFQAVKKPIPFVSLAALHTAHTHMHWQYCIHLLTNLCNTEEKP